MQSLLENLYTPIILVFCLCIGYILKRMKKVNDKYIPLILGLVGAIASILYNYYQDTFNFVVSGLFTGLASVGLHQTFKQFIENPKAGGMKAARDFMEHEIDDPSDDEEVE